MSEEEDVKVDFSTPFSISLIAPPRSGKTFSMNYLMGKAKTAGWKSIWVISGTPDSKNYPFTHPSCVHSYNEKIFNTILKTLKEEKEKNGKRKFVICFDDLGMYSRKIRGNERLEGLCTLYRHYNCSLVFACQYATQMSPTMRECSQIVISFAQNNQKSLDLLYDMIGASMDVKNKKEFIKILKEITSEEYTALLVNTQEKGYGSFKAE